MGTGEPAIDRRSRMVAALTRDISGADTRAFPALPDPVAAPSVRPREQYATLDGLRGVAALCVASLHLPLVFGMPPLPNAHLAVDFFLQLSGFIVAYAYGPQILAGMPLGSFARRRTGRLYPAFLLGLILGLVSASLGLILMVKPDPGAVLCNLIPNLVMMPQPCADGLLYPLNAPMWSILFEVIFSFAFFATASWLLVRRHVLPAAGVLLFLVALIVPNLDSGARANEMLEALIRLGASFLIGVAIYTLDIRIRRQSNLIPVLLGLLLMGLLIFPVRSVEYEYALISVAFPVILLLASIYAPNRTAVTWAALQLGVMSYMLYAIHFPLYELIAAFAPAEPWVGPVALGTVAVLAWGLSRTYEPWARAVFERATTRRETTTHPRTHPVKDGSGGEIVVL